MNDSLFAMMTAINQAQNAYIQIERAERERLEKLSPPFTVDKIRRISKEKQK
jgi:hypothetical protein